MINSNGWKIQLKYMCAEHGNKLRKHWQMEGRKQTVTIMVRHFSTSLPIVYVSTWENYLGDKGLEHYDRTNGPNN